MIVERKKDEVFEYDKRIDYEIDFDEVLLSF